MNVLIQPTDAEKETAGPYRGKTLKVRRVSLNDPDALAGLQVLGGFALHPSLGVSAVDEQGLPLEKGELVFVVKETRC